jgi:hypothetical protein
MTALTVAAIIAGYLAIGVTYARANAIRYYQRCLNNNIKNFAFHPDSAAKYAEDEYKHVQLAAVFLWPLVIPYDFGRGSFAAWMSAPLTDRRDRANQLRADAGAWREKQRTGTEQERQMASELARICDERAAELDL